MALLIRDLPDYIKEQLDKRRGTLSSQTPKSAWFRFTSNADPEGMESGQVLMGGAFGLDEVDESGFDGNIPAGFFGQYDFSQGSAARPEPGAVSASVSKKGDDLQMTVEWKCWTPGQLKELAPYFLTPGISVILEMGWSKITASQRQAVVNVSDVDAKRELYRNKPQDSGEDGPIYTLDGNGGPIHPLQERRRQGGGNYDIYVGQIGDFSLDYNDDGGFDCTTEVVGVSTSIIALRAVDQKNRNNDNAGGEDAPKKPSFFEFITERSAGSSSDDIPAYNIDEVKREDVGAGNWASVGGVEYLSWEAVEQALLNPFVSYRNALVKGQDVMSWDSSGVEVSYFPEMLSTDPSICVVVPKKTQMPSEGSDGGSIRGFSEGSESDSPKRGPLYNLYVSKRAITKTVKENKNASIGEIVKRILDKCSSVCFNIWDFQIHEEANNLKVVDSHATGLVDENKNRVYTFRPYTNETILESFNIDASLDDLIKSQVLIGSRIADSGRDEDHDVNGGQGSATADLFGRVDDPVFPRGFENPGASRKSTGENANPTGGVKGIELGDPNKVDLLEEDPERFEELPENFGYVVAEGYKDLIATPEKARELRQKINKDTEEDSPVNANRNLPIDVSLELKGIGGLEKFQTFDVANLPDSLDEGVFMVKEVDHEISDNTWTTSITGQYRTRNLYDDGGSS